LAFTDWHSINRFRGGRNYKTRFETLRAAVEAKISHGSVGCPQTLLKGTQPELVRLGSISAATRPVISNTHAKSAILTGAFDPDTPAFPSDRDGMVHGIFGQRLYRKRGNVELERLWINL
jgi:hypothetical protein